MRPCEGCHDKQITSDKLVCYACWKLVPRQLMARLYAAWNDGEMTDDYDLAREAVIAVIDRKRAKSA